MQPLQLAVGFFGCGYDCFFTGVFQPYGCAVEHRLAAHFAHKRETGPGHGQQIVEIQRRQSGAFGEQTALAGEYADHFAGFAVDTNHRARAGMQFFHQLGAGHAHLGTLADMLRQQQAALFRVQGFRHEPVCIHAHHRGRAFLPGQLDQHLVLT